MSTTTTTLTATMAELKSEPAHGSLWSNYGSSVPLSTRFPNHMDSGLAHPAGTSSSRPRSSVPSIDTHYPYHRYGQEEAESFDRHSQQPQHQQSLSHHSSYPAPKRPYQHGEHPPYQEMVQDLRDDNAKLTVNHDHKLLSFRRAQDKHTIVDQHGRMQQLELSAQLHGMFFLSEMPSNTSDGAMLQPELTCYRRNLFQISGSLVTPRGQLSVVQADTGETVPVTNTEVTISAIESVDNHPVRLIVIPWKTPPPNSPELPQTADQEPPSLPLIPFPDDGQEADGEYAVYPIGWRRLQFRIATANNGRRKELQQHFVLHLKVVATLANGTKAILTESTTAPIVVRGRSPRNFQARKEIPLLGSSAGSRGQALVETGLGIVAGPLSAKPQDPKMRALNLELPRTAFTFNANKIPGSSMTMRSNSYPTWSPSSQVPLSQMPASASTNYPASSLPQDSYQKMPLSGASNYSAEPQEMPLQSSSIPSVQLPLTSSDQQPQQPGPIRTQYAAYAPGNPTTPLSASSSATDHHHQNSLSVPRYVDSNPRPSKSPRHGGHQSVHSASSITNDPSTSEYRYGPSTYTSVSETSAPTYATSGTLHDTSSAAAQPPPPPPSAASHQQHQPQQPQSQSHRDYYSTSSGSWGPPATTTTAEVSGSVPSYHNGLTETSRSYSLNDQYKPPPPPPLQTKTEHHIPPPAAPSSYSSTMNHYSWSPT